MSQIYECQICCEEQRFSDSESACDPPSADCNHDRTICDDCMGSIFDREIRSGIREYFICPDWKCTEKVPLELVRNIATPELYEIYMEKGFTLSRIQDRAKAIAARILKMTMERDTRAGISKTTKKCPKAGCGTVIESFDADCHMACTVCRTEFRWRCKVIYPDKRRLHLIACKEMSGRMVAKEDLDTTGHGQDWDVDVDVRYDQSLDEPMNLY